MLYFSSNLSFDKMEFPSNMSWMVSIPVSHHVLLYAGLFPISMRALNQIYSCQTLPNLNKW